MRYEYETVLNDIEVKLVTHLVPSSPPIIRADPGNDDPGDAGERSVEAVLIKNRRTGKFIDITDCFTEEDLDELADEAFEYWQENRE